MRYSAKLFGLVALTGLMMPVSQFSGLAQESEGLEEVQNRGASVQGENAEDLKAEADRLDNEAFQLWQTDQYQAAWERLQQALELYRHPAVCEVFPQASRQQEARVLTGLGAISSSLSQYEQALNTYQEALLIRREIGDRRGEGVTLNNIGLVYDNLGKYEQALNTYQDALLIAQEIGNRRGEGITLSNIGLVYDNLGKYEQALNTYQDALLIAQEIGNRRGEGTTLSNIGAIYDNLGKYEQALNTYQEALLIAQEIGDRLGEGTTLNNIGAVYKNLGQYEQALNTYQDALLIAQEIGDRRGEGTTLNNIGLVYNNLEQYEQALNTYQDALLIRQEIGDRLGEGVTLSNIGLIYRKLEQYEQALNTYQDALLIAQEISDRRGEGVTLNNIGAVYKNLGQYEQALNTYQEALLIAQEIGDRHGEGVTLSNIGLIYRKLEQYEQALNTYQDALLIAQEISDRRGEGVTLNNIGAVYKNLGQYEQALNTYQEALLIAQEIGDRHGEGVTLNNIGYLLEATEEPELAIVFLKQSVNQYEEIRGDIQGLSAEDQQTFTDSISSTYRKLADLLLQQNRIIEAQRVLDLLKVQELDEYLDDVQRNAQTETGVEFWQPEEDVLALYDDVLLAGTELARLQERDRNSLTPDEQARLAELTAQQDRVYTSFIDWLDHPDIITAIDQLREATRSRTVDIENFTDLQAQLAQLPQRSVILYPLVLENRLELVLVSADAPPVRYPVDVDAVELNRTVVTFGQALKDRNIDPRPLAKQIYDWTIANLETDLAAVGAENIIFAPDGVLRYVPLAALYDGEQWLAERFSFSQITAASETDFAARPRDRRTLLAAACADCAFTVNIGDDAFSFGNLPATLQEVELLASQIPGAELLINGEFTPARFKDLLGSANLIHLATHGKFVSGNPDESFILFGDEQSVNLREMRREWSQLDADLVVLSACETALGSPELGNGIEVLGLGFQLQRVGAKAVMASLWQVSDNGTQALMAEFYDGLNQGMTKAEALQAAQMAMITNQPSENAGQADLSAIADTGSEADGTVRAVSLAAQEMPGYSHPYYWAPFILIGNGL